MMEAYGECGAFFFIKGLQEARPQSDTRAEGESLILAGLRTDQPQHPGESVTEPKAMFEYFR